MKIMNLMLDTFAVIELFRGSDKGTRVKQLLEKNVTVYISVLSLFEIGTVLEREISKKSVREYVRSIETHYHVLDVNKDTANLAVDLRRDYKLPAIDCLIYAGARLKKAKVVSGCKHFKKISKQKDVMII